MSKSIRFTSAFTLSLALALPLVVGACDKSDSKSDDKSGDKKKDEGSKDAGSKKSTVTLAELDNLKVDVAEGTKPSKMGPSVMIMSMEESFTVDVARDSTPATLEDAKKEAVEMFTAKNVSEEKLDDGWAITYENTGSMGENYFAAVRREIGGKAYYCHTMVGNKILRDGALAACKTLRK